MFNKFYKISLIPHYCRGDTPALYTILPEKQASVGGAMMGSSHVYDIAAVSTTVQTIIFFFYILRKGCTWFCYIEKGNHTPW